MHAVLCLNPWCVCVCVYGHTSRLPVHVYACLQWHQARVLLGPLAPAAQGMQVPAQEVYVKHRGVWMCLGV